MASVGVLAVNPRSVVVGDSNSFCGAIDPPKYDPPLLVDADRVMARQVAGQRLQPVARRRREVLEVVRLQRHLIQLPSCNSRDRCRKPTSPRRSLAVIEVLGRLVTEAPDHLIAL